MRALGFVLVLLGLVVAGFGYRMDTTVPLDVGGRPPGAAAPERVHNLGKLEQRRDAINAGSVMLVIGVLLAAVGSRGHRPPEFDPRKDSSRGLLDLGSGDVGGRR